jgi:hypothetical protein
LTLTRGGRKSLEMNPAQNQFSLNRAVSMGKFLSVILLGALSLLSRSAAESLEDPDREFRFHGKPIHPLLVKQFEPWISDARPPITVEINLTAAWDSNEYAAEFKTDSNAVVSVSLPEGSSYSYRHLGRLKDGIHVLRTFDSSGGSGVFEAVLFVRLRTSLAYLADGVKQGQQVFLQVVRRYPLGDRDKAEVVVKQDHVIVGRSRYRAEPVLLRFGEIQTRPATQKSK